MRKVRNILAVALVAMALCADRAVASAPAVRPAIGLAPRQVVGQLTRRFRHVVPAVKIVQDRQEGVRSVPPMRPVPVETPVGLHASESTPFQFRLPPPAL